MRARRVSKHLRDARYLAQLFGRAQPVLELDEIDDQEADIVGHGRRERPRLWASSGPALAARRGHRCGLRWRRGRRRVAGRLDDADEVSQLPLDVLHGLQVPRYIDAVQRQQ